jgi:hypothetical protein
MMVKMFLVVGWLDGWKWDGEKGGGEEGTYYSIIPTIHGSPPLLRDDVRRLIESGLHLRAINHQWWRAIFFMDR